MRTRPLFTLVATSLAALAAPSFAQGTPPAHVDRVLVYPGGAVVERVVAVKAGQKSLTLGCLPTSFDADSLQIEGDGVRVAQISVQTVERKGAPECRDTPLAQRIRALQAQSQALQDEVAAQDVALQSLRNIGQGITAAQVGSAADAVQRSAQLALSHQTQTREKLRVLDEQLAPLLAQQQRIEASSPQVATLRARLLVEHDAELRVTTRTQQAGWQPYYRAALDTTTQRLRLERHARVGQATGEDWQGVKLVLLTTAPSEAVIGGTPGSWDLNLYKPLATAKFSTVAAAPMMARAAMAPTSASSADFDVSVFNGTYATEFTLPGPVDVQSGAEKVALALGETQLNARVVERVDPQQQPAAFLVAEAARPDGAWPRGPVQMFRDGRFVGESWLAFSDNDRLDLGFGRDEQLRVDVLPQDDNKGEAGFIGSRNSKHIVRRYVIANHHDRAVQVQVLEATPVSRDEKIEVEAKLDPAPLAGDWRERKGVRAWEFSLVPGAEQKLTADYRFTWPKDEQLQGGGR